MNGVEKGDYHRPPYRAPLKQSPRGGIPPFSAPLHRLFHVSGVVGRLPCYFFYAF